MTPESVDSSGARSDAAAVRALIAGTARLPVRLSVLSASMSPTLLPGDVLRVRPASGKELRSGDVAVFLRDGKVLAHRVILSLRFGLGFFILEMGDANGRAARLHPKAVIGMVEAAERDGRAVRFASRAGGTGREARRMARRLLLRCLKSCLPTGFTRRIWGR